MALKSHLGNEVFVIGRDATNVSVESLEVYTGFFDTVDALATKTPISGDDDIMVLHGVAVPANVIPKNFNNLDVFVLVDIPDKGIGVIYPVESGEVKEVEQSIKALIDATELEYGIEVSIEDVFLLFGSELTVVLTILQEEQDEEIIERGLRLAKFIRAARENIEMEE
jgi:hypothetical protein